METKSEPRGTVRKRLGRTFNKMPYFSHPKQNNMYVEPSPPKSRSLITEEPSSILPEQHNVSCDGDKFNRRDTVSVGCYDDDYINVYILDIYTYMQSVKHHLRRFLKTITSYKHTYVWRWIVLIACIVCVRVFVFHPQMTALSSTNAFPPKSTKGERKKSMASTADPSPLSIPTYSYMYMPSLVIPREKKTRSSPPNRSKSNRRETKRELKPLTRAMFDDGNDVLNEKVKSMWGVINFFQTCTNIMKDIGAFVQNEKKRKSIIEVYKLIRISAYM